MSSLGPRPALLAVCAWLLAGCATTNPAAVSWGPVGVEASPLPPRSLLQIRVLGRREADLESALRTAIAEGRVGSSSSGTFTLSLTPHARVVHEGRVHAVRLRFSLDHDGRRLIDDEIAASASTATDARKLAVARLLARASAVLQRHEQGARAAQGFDLPAIVVVERVAHSRDLLELSFVETASGAVLRREIVPLPDAAAGPPGRFVLSRRTVEGKRLDDEGYALLVRQTKDFLDLRPIGEAACLGYFGPKNALSPAPASRHAEPPPRTSTPPRR